MAKTLILLPFLLIIILLYFFSKKLSRKDNGQIFILTALSFSIFVLLTTEILSIFNIYSNLPLAISYFVIYCIFGFLLYPLFTNSIKPILGPAFFQNPKNIPSIFINTRKNQYFSSEPTIASSYIRLVDSINKNKCQQVGLIMGFAGEYQLWAIDDSKKIRYHNIFVENKTANINRKEIPICAIAKIAYPKNDNQKSIIYEGKNFNEIWRDPTVAYYR